MEEYKVIEEFTLPATDEQEEKVVAVGETIAMEPADAEALVGEGILELIPGGQPGQESNTQVSSGGTSPAQPKEVKAVEVLGKGEEGGIIKVFTLEDGKDFKEQAEKLAAENGFEVNYK